MFRDPKNIFDWVILLSNTQEPIILDDPLSMGQLPVISITKSSKHKRKRQLLMWNFIYTVLPFFLGLGVGIIGFTLYQDEEFRLIGQVLMAFGALIPIYFIYRVLTKNPNERTIYDEVESGLDPKKEYEKAVLDKDGIRTFNQLDQQIRFVDRSRFKGIGVFPEIRDYMSSSSSKSRQNHIHIIRYFICILHNDESCYKIGIVKSNSLALSISVRLSKLLETPFLSLSFDEDIRPIQWPRQLIDGRRNPLSYKYKDGFNTKRISVLSKVITVTHSFFGITYFSSSINASDIVDICIRPYLLRNLQYRIEIIGFKNSIGYGQGLDKESLIKIKEELRTRLGFDLT